MIEPSRRWWQWQCGMLLPKNQTPIYINKRHQSHTFFGTCPGFAEPWCAAIVHLQKPRHGRKKKPASANGMWKWKILAIHWYTVATLTPAADPASKHCENKSTSKVPSWIKHKKGCAPPRAMPFPCHATGLWKSVFFLHITESAASSVTSLTPAQGHSKIGRCKKACH